MNHKSVFRNPTVAVKFLAIFFLALIAPALCLAQSPANLTVSGSDYAKGVQLNNCMELQQKYDDAVTKLQNACSVLGTDVTDAGQAAGTRPHKPRHKTDDTTPVMPAGYAHLGGENYSQCWSKATQCQAAIRDASQGDDVDTGTDTPITPQNDQTLFAPGNDGGVSSAVTQAYSKCPALAVGTLSDAQSNEQTAKSSFDTDQTNLNNLKDKLLQLQKQVSDDQSKYQQQQVADNQNLQDLTNQMQQLTPDTDQKQQEATQQEQAQLTKLNDQLTALRQQAIAYDKNVNETLVKAQQDCVSQANQVMQNAIKELNSGDTNQGTLTDLQYLKQQYMTQSKLTLQRCLGGPSYLLAAQEAIRERLENQQELNTEDAQITQEQQQITSQLQSQLADMQKSEGIQAQELMSQISSLKQKQASEMQQFTADQQNLQQQIQQLQQQIQVAQSEANQSQNQYILATKALTMAQKGDVGTGEGDQTTGREAMKTALTQLSVAQSLSSQVEKCKGLLQDTTNPPSAQHLNNH